MTENVNTVGLEERILVPSEGGREWEERGEEV